MKNAARMLVNKLPKLANALAELAGNDVLVGVPRDETSRPGPGEAMTNATLAYIHDNGSPAANIPARPFMDPGIKDSKESTVANFKMAAKAVLKGKGEQVIRYYHRAGLAASTAVKNRINAGIAPPLADSTLRARARAGSKGAKAELKSRAEGNEPGMGNAKPLVRTAQMRNSITYVLRERKRK